MGAYCSLCGVDVHVFSPGKSPLTPSSRAFEAVRQWGEQGHRGPLGMVVATDFAAQAASNPTETPL